MASVGEVIQRANELAIAGANGALGASDRQAMAQEVSQLIESITQDAGAKYNGDYIFSGFKVDKPPYTVTGPGTVGAYQGDHGVLIARIGPASTMQLSVAGDAAFQPAIDALTQLNDDLQSGSAGSAGDDHQDPGGARQLCSPSAPRSARGPTVSIRPRPRRQSMITSNQALLSQLEDADMPTAITELTKRQTTYQATLAVTAKVMQTSLIDYLR